MTRMETIIAAVQIMGKGMGGIFVAIILIMLVVWLMGKLTNHRK